MSYVVKHSAIRYTKNSESVKHLVQMQAAIYLQDEFSQKLQICSVFGADLYYHKLALKVAQVILLFLWYNNSYKNAGI